MSLNNDKNLPQSQFAYSFAGATQTGLVRAKNEDSFTCVPEQNLWVVADGMGGHDAGDYASQLITRQAEKFAQQATLESSILLLEENLLHTNKLIQQKAREMGGKSSIGSTVVCLYTWKNLAFVLWAGDSRAYRLRRQKVERLTEDHSFVEELVRMGKIEASEAETHPAANVVLNAVGIDDSLNIDIEYFEIEHGDLFMLCSDGLYKDLSDDKISGILDQPELPIESINQQLMDSALEQGGSDNCSVILVKAEKKENGFK